LSPEVRNANPLAVGTRLQEFVIERVIGIGGFGIVYQANDSLLRRSVAIKEYMPVSLAMRGEGNTVGLISASFKEDFDNGRRTFIEEARMLAQFKHPALIEVLRYWEDNRTAYMVTPFYSGRTLDDFLRKRAEPIQEAELRRILLPVLDALGHMHAEQVYHRDISPDNIMVLDNGSPILLDLGAARRLEAMNPRAVTVLVKPGYAPIEQYAGEIAGHQGPWTDLYGWGASAYFALVGKPPPPCASRVMCDTIAKLGQLRPAGYSAAFLEAIDATLAVRPDDRPQSVQALQEMLALEHGLRDTLPAPEIKGVALPEPKHAVPLGEAFDDTTVIRKEIDIPPPIKIDPPSTAAQTRKAVSHLAPAVPAIPKKSSSLKFALAAGCGLVVIATIAWMTNASTDGNRPQPITPVAASPAPSPTLTALPEPPQADVAQSSPAAAAVSGASGPPEKPVEEALPSDKPAIARLNIKPWGEVWLNGVQKGVSPPLKSLSLPAGDYTVSLRNGDYPAKTFKLKLSPGQSIPLNHTFVDKN
jgi:serine/threonine protein kinase